MEAHLLDRLVGVGGQAGLDLPGGVRLQDVHERPDLARAGPVRGEDVHGVEGVMGAKGPGGC